MTQESNVTVIRAGNRDRAVVFLHGFTGERDDTWDRFPGLLGSSLPDWDILTVGYATTLLPDVMGVWSADPDLPILSKLLCTQLSIPPLQPYSRFALIAHSMGGLVLQKALVDDPDLARRVEHVMLFGTPSAGLPKLSWIRFWKRQLRNMARGSEFITELRKDWNRLYGPGPPFGLLIVAGASDQFVPPDSSLQPFETRYQRVVVGDHVSIVKPANTHAPSLQLVMATLDAPRFVMKAGNHAAGFSVRDIVDAALALDRAGQRAESMALLERHQDKDTDVKGTLAGRVKRIWFETEQPSDAERCLALYQEALGAAKEPDQIYYLAINLAFMRFVYKDDNAGAEEMARLAMQYADPPGDDLWKTATVAEAYLYLRRIPEALGQYRRLLTLQAERWKHQSASLQASRIAAKLGDRLLAEELEAIFTPGARRVNRILVSYSHKDRDWLERLREMIAPYLHDAETELDLWDDTRPGGGERRDVEFRDALARSGVAVALVSSKFLGSRYVLEHQLPAMIEAAVEGGLKLLWVSISAAAWEETPIRRFQATHDISLTLEEQSLGKQNAILKSIAHQMKEAALSATKPFREAEVK